MVVELPRVGSVWCGRSGHTRRIDYVGRVSLFYIDHRGQRRQTSRVAWFRWRELENAIEIKNPK